MEFSKWKKFKIKRKKLKEKNKRKNFPNGIFQMEKILKEKNFFKTPSKN